MAGHILPQKVAGHLRRLIGAYEASGDHFLPALIESARFFVREETEEYTDLGETSVGHDVVLFIPMLVLQRVTLDEDRKTREKLRDDLNRCGSSVPLEYIRMVSFEVQEDADQEFQRSRSVSALPKTTPEGVAFWKPGQIRLFISHRDTHKNEAHALADAVAMYGICAFVAHDTIEPMTTWRDEVQKGLETMEVMLAFVTDDFDDSVWTHQEIGFALGRGVPIISLQLQKAAPSGFLEARQAIKGRLDQPALAVEDIYKVLAEKLGNRDRLQSALISAFVEANDFNEARNRFDRLNAVVEKLTDQELQTIIEGFSKNDQLYRAGHLTSRYNRLLNFLDRTAGKKFEFVTGDVKIREIRPVVVPDFDDEIPF
jgi:hypothetical protein